MRSRITGLTTLAVAGALVLTACSGRVQTNQNQPAPSGGSTAGTDAMIAELTMPAEVAENVAGLVKLQPVLPELPDQDVLLRAADDPELAQL